MSTELKCEEIRSAI